MRFVALIVASLVVVVFAGCGGGEKPSAAPSQAALTKGGPLEETATLLVTGLSCPLCASNIDKRLLDVPGVKHVDVDLKTGSVALKMDSDPSRRPARAALARAVEESGFTLSDIKTP